MSKKCTSCNELVNDDAMFCSKCGNQSFEIVSDNSSSEVNSGDFNLGQISEQKDNGVGFDTVDKEQPIMVQENVVQGEQIVNVNQAPVQTQPVNQPQVQTQTVAQPQVAVAPPPGVINNDTFANQGAPAQKKKKKSTKIDSKVIWTISGIIGAILLVISLVLFILLFLAGGVEEEESGGDGGSVYNPSSYFTDKNSKLIGTDDFGYIKIPSTWLDISSTYGDGFIVFTDNVENGKWFVLVSSVADGATTPEILATSTYNGLISDGALEVAAGQEIVNDFTTYKVVAYKPYQQRYTASWYFATDDGKTRYIVIEGPDRTHEFYNMIYTYTLTK